MFKRSAIAVAVLLAAATAGGAFAKSHQSKNETPTAQMKKVLDAMKSLGATGPSQGSVKQAREGVTAKDAVRKILQNAKRPTEPEAVFKIERRTIPSPGGDLALEVYTPEGEGPFPAVVYFHGGGFVIADSSVYDPSARALANQSKAVVISVDYRRAPENPYPAALDDASAAFRYVHDHPGEFNIEANKIAVAGESAGGNLATAVAIRAHKEQSPMPIYQVLIYPFVGTDLQTPSHLANGKGNYLISNEDLAFFWQNYLGDEWKQTSDPLAVPLKASTEDLRGLPPALIITAGLDPLKDDGSEYVKKLREAGVQVKLRNFPSVTHEFFGMSPVLDASKQAQQEVAAALKAAFAKRGEVGMRK